MEIYRYFATHAFETLTDRLLMMSQASSLNDPFEFAYKRGGDITVAQAKKLISTSSKNESFLNEVRKFNPEVNSRKKLGLWLAKNRNMLAHRFAGTYHEMDTFKPDYPTQKADAIFRICCFSSSDIKPSEEILLWSHYANKHQGIRIAFDIDGAANPHYALKTIKYSPNRVALDLRTGDSAMARKGLSESWITKAIGWAYEREIRLITSKKYCKPVVGEDGVTRHFLLFETPNVKSIAFGVNCPTLEIKRVSNLVREQYPHATLWQATKHQSEFSIAYRALH